MSGLVCIKLFDTLMVFVKDILEKVNFKQEDQVALNRSPGFYLKLTYRYLLKAGHVPSDT